MMIALKSMCEMKPMYVFFFEHGTILENFDDSQCGMTQSEKKEARVNKTFAYVTDSNIIRFFSFLLKK